MSGSTLITAEQVATINEARTALKAIADSAFRDNDSQASGMIYALADVADAHLFQLLNWFTSHAHGVLTYEQLHNQAADADAA